MGDKIDFPGATIIEGDDEMRARKCLQIIQNTLTMYRCVIVPIVSIVGTTIEPSIKVFAIPDKTDAQQGPSEDG